MYPQARPRPNLLFAVALGLAPGAALAQSSYTLTETFGTFSSIASTGTPVSVDNTDDGYGTVNLPFTFNFFGNSVSTIYPCTNGFVSFDTPANDLSPDTFPSFSAPNGIAAAYWTDLVLGSGTIYTRQVGQVFVIEWAGINIYQSTDTISFQIRLHQSTGEIEMLYGPSTGTGSPSGAGVEDSSGSVGVGRSCGTSCTFADVPNGTLLRFTPGAVSTSVDLSIASVSPLPGTVTPGNQYSASVTVVNNGSDAARNFNVRLVADFAGTPVTIAETSITQLSGGGTVTETLSFVVPSGIPQGSYTVIAVVDAGLTVSESDENNNDMFVGSITVGGGGGSITVTTANVPPGTAGTAYSFQLQQSGASSPTWSIASGSLPAGISLSSSGRLSGTPSAPGTSTFTVLASQSGLSPGTATYQLEVTGSTGFRLSTTMLPQGTVGTPYTGRLEATGGAAPYGYQAFAGTPSWMRVLGDGTISGTPDAPGNHEIRVSVFDSQSRSIEGVVLLEVVQGGPLEFAVSQDAFVNGVVGSAYDVELAARGGSAPYTFSISNGNLPAGLALNGNRVQGVPTAAGRSSFTVQVSDGAGGSATLNVSIEVVERTVLVIEVPERITIRPQTPASVMLTASGGVPPYTWAITTGTLPDGLTLDGNTIRGTSTSSRTVSSMVTFRVTDTQAGLAEKTVTVEVRFSGATMPSNGNGGNQSRSRGGCASVSTESASPVALLALLAWGAMIARRRRTFLAGVSVVDHSACPRSSSPDAPRSSGR